MLRLHNYKRNCTHKIKRLGIQVLSLFCWICIIQPLPTFSQIENTAVVDFIHTAFVNQTENQTYKQFEKVEIGVQLPPRIQREIDAFLNKKTTEEVQGINPFLEWEIRVYATFQQDYKPGEVIEIDGFYTKEFTSYMLNPLPKPRNGSDYTDEEYKRAGGYIQMPNSFPFRIRFAPPIAGKWSYQVHVELVNKSFHSDKVSFDVLENETKGYISVHEKGRFLSHKGKPFIPSGENAPWPETYVAFDSSFYAYHTFESNGVKYYKPEYYRNVYALPRTYKTYRNVLNNLANSGTTYIRTIMAPISTEIEWEEMGNYQNRLHMAQEMDSIVYLAESKGFFLHWNMNIHYTFKHGVYYITLWDWEDKDGTPSFAYKKELGLNEPIDFFSNEKAKMYYKQRIRYILSRWGYSPNIGMFELFSEISNVGLDQYDGSAYYKQHVKIFEAWQQEMAAYIKSQYHGQIHPLTSSYSGELAREDCTYFDSPNFDVMSSNIYDFGTPDFGRFFTRFVSEYYLNENPFNWKGLVYTMKCDPAKQSKGCSYAIKPLIFSESEPVEVVSWKKNQWIEMNRFLWQAPFSGLAVCLPWSNWYMTKNYEIHGQINEFVSRNLTTFDWHPGASRLVQKDSLETWHYSTDFEYKMTNENRRADLVFLRSNDCSKAVGVITNKTYNVYTIDTLYSIPDDFPWKLRVPKTVNSKREKLQVQGMKKGTYEIRYYFPDALDKPFKTERINSKKLFLDVVIPATENGYIIMFEMLKIE